MKVTIPSFGKALKEVDRMAIAQTILEHLKLCGWGFFKTHHAVKRANFSFMLSDELPQLQTSPH